MGSFLDGSNSAMDQHKTELKMRPMMSGTCSLDRRSKDETDQKDHSFVDSNGGTIQRCKKEVQLFCLASGIVFFFFFFRLTTTYINEQVNRPSFLMTTFFLLSMGECVLEAESGSMRGEFLCATAADIFFFDDEIRDGRRSTFGYVTRKYTEKYDLL